MSDRKPTQAKTKAKTKAKATRTIKVDALARVEGEGALHITIAGGQVSHVALRIYEPPRFFEGLLRGRRHDEAPDITARICGICPVAYQMSACHAIEAACGVTVDGPLRALRRLLYCGEWIESHALHVYMLHAPDFLGYDSGIAMARDHAGEVERGLRLKKAGNAIVALLGGRAIHPINVRVGGFHRTPRRSELEALAGELTWAREAACATVRWVAGFRFPDFERDWQLVALSHPDEYPMNEGRVVSTSGLSIPASAFEEHFTEHQVAHSSALHCTVDEQAYLVGPLARYNLCHDRLTPLARDTARAAGLGPVCRNPFQSILIRAVEMVHACDEALAIIAAYHEPERPAVAVVPRAAIGHACTEAPRGLLYHRYELDSQGVITHATIVPPTSQNQKSIEDDLRAFVAPRIDLPTRELTWQCEQAVRNHDPCISCATHFLRLTVDRT